MAVGAVLEKLAGEPLLQAEPAVDVVVLQFGEFRRVFGDPPAYVDGPIFVQTVDHESAQLAFTSTSIVLVSGAILNPVSGRLSVRFDQRPLFLAAGTTGVSFAVPAFALMASGTSTIVVIAAQILLAIPVSLSIGPRFPRSPGCSAVGRGTHTVPRPSIARRS